MKYALFLFLLLIPGVARAQTSQSLGQGTVGCSGPCSSIYSSALPAQPTDTDLDRAYKICLKPESHQQYCDMGCIRTNLLRDEYEVPCEKISKQWHGTNDEANEKAAAEQDASDLEFVKRIAGEQSK